ncbi:hypothetical protein Tco_0002316 [Tanacetum coccineum]
MVVDTPYPMVVDNAENSVVNRDPIGLDVLITIWRAIPASRLLGPGVGSTWRIQCLGYGVLSECRHRYAISSLIDMAYWLSEQYQDIDGYDEKNHAISLYFHVKKKVTIEEFFAGGIKKIGWIYLNTKPLCMLNFIRSIVRMSGLILATKNVVQLLKKLIQLKPEPDHLGRPHPNHVGHPLPIQPTLGFDMQVLVEHFNPVEDNTGVLEYVVFDGLYLFNVIWDVERARYL